MIINGSRDKSETVELNLTNMRGSNVAQEISYSKKQFQLDSETLLPTRSERPSVKRISLKKKNKITLEPYSIKILRYLK